MTNGDEIDELKSEVINSLNSYPKEIIDELIDSSVFDALLRYKINKFAVESIDLSDSERSDAVSCFLKTKSFDSDERLREVCSESGQSIDRVYSRIYMNAKLEKHVVMQYGKSSESLFLENKLSLDKVVYSLLRVSSEELARELFFRLEDAEINFAEIAAQYSEGPERNTGGRVGPISPSKAHPNVAKYLISAEEGHLIDPFKADKYWIILRVESRTTAVYDDAMKTELSMHLHRKKSEALVRSLLKHFDAEAFSGAS